MSSVKPADEVLLVMFKMKASRAQPWEVAPGANVTVRLLISLLNLLCLICTQGQFRQVDQYS